MSVDYDLDAMTEGVWATIPIMKEMGLRLVDLGHGHAAATIPVEPNKNHFGMMYAGSLFTVAEMLGGALSLATWEVGEFIPIVKDLQIRFRRPAATAVRAETSLAPDEIERVMNDALASGKGEFVLEATVTDEAGEVVATTVGTYQLRKM